MVTAKELIREVVAVDAERKVEREKSAEAARERRAEEHAISTEFREGVVKPALDRVKAELEAPEVGRNVAIRYDVSGLITLQVENSDNPYPTSKELSVKIETQSGFYGGERRIFVSQSRTYGKWTRLEGVSGLITDVSQDQLFDALIAAWAKNVKG